MVHPRDSPGARTGSLTWPPRVVAAPISSSAKVVRARRGTAAARRPTSVVRSGGTAVAVVGIGRTGGGRRAEARLDTALNRHHPPQRVPLRQPRHAHQAGRDPVNFSYEYSSLEMHAALRQIRDWMHDPENAEIISLIRRHNGHKLRHVSSLQEIFSFLRTAP